MSEVQTPTAAIIADANPLHTVVDSDGRKITYKTLSILDEMRLLRAIGAEHSSNVAYVNLAKAAAMVQAIDGTPQPAPLNLRQIEGSMERLGDNGFVAMLLDLQKQNEDAPAEDWRTEAKN